MRVAACDLVFHAPTFRGSGLAVRIRDLVCWVGTCGVAVVDQSVEVDIGKSKALEMLRLRHHRPCMHKSLT